MGEKTASLVGLQSRELPLILETVKYSDYAAQLRSRSPTTNGNGSPQMKFSVSGTDRYAKGSEVLRFAILKGLAYTNFLVSHPNLLSCKDSPSLYFIVQEIPAEQLNKKVVLSGGTLVGLLLPERYKGEDIDLVTASDIPTEILKAGRVPRNVLYNPKTKERIQDQIEDIKKYSNSWLKQRSSDYAITQIDFQDFEWGGRYAVWLIDKKSPEEPKGVVSLETTIIREHAEPPEIRPIENPYDFAMEGDQYKTPVLSINRNELLAQKFRAAYYNLNKGDKGKASMDLFDAFLLDLHHKARLSYDLLDKKLKEMGGYSVEGMKRKLEERINEVKERPPRQQEVADEWLQQLESIYPSQEDILQWALELLKGTASK